MHGPGRGRRGAGDDVQIVEMRGERPGDTQRIIFAQAGFIVFVNFVQLAALRDANETERPAIVRHIVPRTARVFTGAAHATLFTGILMLLPSMPTLVARPLLLGSVVAGVAMWAIVQFILRPNVQRITGKVAASDPEKAQARMTIARWARINLVLVIPTAVAMMIAAHAGM